MIGGVARWTGFTLGLLAGIALFPFWWATAQVTGVVRYRAHDHEHGAVIVEERSNRVTGTVTRRVFRMPEDYPPE